MKHQITKLANGLRIATMKIPGAETVAVTATVGVGSRNENPDNLGIAHAIEHSVFNGIEKEKDGKIIRRTQAQIEDKFDAIAADANAETSTATTFYCGQVLPKNVATLTELLSDLVRYPSFPKERIRPEIKEIRQEIAEWDDDHTEVANFAANKIMFNGNPLAYDELGRTSWTNGTLHKKRKIPLDYFDQHAFKTFHAEHYHPENIVMSAVGNIDHDAFVQEVTKHFGDMPKKEHDVDMSYPPYDLERYKGGTKHVHRRLQQTHIEYNLLAPNQKDPRFPAMEVYAAILGQTGGAKLYKELRIHHSLIYKVSTVLSPSDQASYLQIKTPTTHKPGKLLKIISEQIASFADTVTESDVERARTYILTEKAKEGLKLDELASDLGNQLILFGDYQSREKYEASIKNVTLEDVKKVAEYFAGQSPTIVTVGKWGPSHETLEEIRATHHRIGLRRERPSAQR